MTAVLQDEAWIGPGSFFDSLPWDITVGSIMVLAILFAIALGIKLLHKYKNNHSKAVLYLGTAMTLFVAASILVLPTLFGLGDLFKIIDDLVTRLVGLAAIGFYFMFAIEVFIPRSEKRQGHVIIPLSFLAINVVFLVLNYVHVLTIYLETGDRYVAQPLLIIQEFLATLPFIYIGMKARLLSKATSDLLETRALNHIALSGLFMFLAYLFLAIDDVVVLDNPFSLPMWVFALLGFVYFYIGVARPARLFQASPVS